jgi:hypothetical protein
VSERRIYEPGDIFRWGDGQYEAVAEGDDDGSCEGCIGDLHTSICDMLPGGCNADGIVWRPLNDTAKVLVVTLKLEGKLP